ncbi:UNVERIFIED_CONTAM: conjugal transfer protein [Clostridioides difficile]|uniref:cysteine-rich KTR domain-containing protein n=1 Tax=Clostridioides difficile TaxID=1496 RepID=UPI000516D400|nr:cysteine-rich KTR domain-containing protein [Clostridioides difficile]MDC2931958.1 cysteine-rich KTR domain-containing protein [Clostridioides difficile]MDE3612317.1 cysteine-rich KTR domain-containing protein [Clostridioides difficile]MDM9793391.1 cysteine-rich KTR domain-containing protein [Clostridioides difficile]HBF7938903.1 cysteine-rich KTR domain-containing protein [Clostridioides difficile]HBG6491860.1 cysteine-rich KTR domain-containing protein [Clostridioides difficile]
MNMMEWVICPICQNKTRLKIREDTIMKNFPLYCPKCKQETLINIRKLNVSIIKEPDA